MYHSLLKKLYLIPLSHQRAQIKFTIWRSKRSKIGLQNCLNTLSSYCSTWVLCINQKTTKFIWSFINALRIVSNLISISTMSLLKFVSILIWTHSFLQRVPFYWQLINWKNRPLTLLSVVENTHISANYLHSFDIMILSNFAIWQ